MIENLAWLALEVKYLDRATAFYEAFLDLDRRESDPDAVVLAAGDHDLILRSPGSVPRGGLHTHYALSIPAPEYEQWYDHLDDRFDLVEHEFDTGRSLFFYDPDGNCVELGEAAVEGPGISGVFEVAVEVESLGPAVEFYQELGADPTDRGDDRVRLSVGELDLELWEPRLGIADARGGVHVDLGLTVSDLEAAVESVPETTPVERLSEPPGDQSPTTETEAAVRLRDPDGHAITLLG